MTSAWLSTVKEWQTLIVGFVAVGAAVVAWRNVSRQIRASNLTAERLETTAFKQICDELRDVVELFNLCWRILDHALTSPNNEKCKTGKAVVISISPHARGFERRTDFSSLIEDLNHIRRRQLSDVLRTIQMIIGHLDGKSDFEEQQSIVWLQTLRTQLTHLEIYLRAFEPVLADIFNGRKRGPVDHRPIASHLVGLVEKFEKTDKI
jgi:hypothetical protein